MDYKIFFAIFATIFLAELGDKTQIATLLFATDKEVSKITVFLASSFALIVATAVGVVVGSSMSVYIDLKYLNLVAGIGFIMIGVFTLLEFVKN